jgi:hemerythrin-like domain-containing protein
MSELIRETAGNGAKSTMAAAIPSLDWWLNAHQEQLRLCAELEMIADSLPANVNRQKCIYAAKALGPMIKGLHHYEENVLFPALEMRGLAGDLAKTLARLKFEHFEDECFAEELSERLLLLGAGGGDVNMEATGYMLRGFFEAIRRHIAFEREHLIDKLDDARLEKAG